MDYIFTQKELYYLDDIMPGFKPNRTASNSKDLDKEEPLVVKYNSLNF